MPLGDPHICEGTTNVEAFILERHMLPSFPRNSRIIFQQENACTNDKNVDS